MNDLINIRECSKCGFILEANIPICTECNFNSTYDIPEHLVNISYKDITSRINDAFYRFECFLSGRLKDYPYFGFNNAFTKLFFETQKHENCNINNDELIRDYLYLLYQIENDIDKGIYKNENIHKSEIFNKELEEICFLINFRLHEFNIFNCIEYPEYRITISDITNKTLIQPQQSTIEQKDYKDKTAFKAGIKLANGQAYQLRKEGFSFRKIALELNFKESDQTYFSQSIGEASKDPKNIYNNLKLLQIIKKHCEEEKIKICPDFSRRCTEKYPNEF